MSIEHVNINIISKLDNSRALSPPVKKIMLRTQGYHLQDGLDTEDGGEEKVENFQRIIELLVICNDVM